MTPRDLDVLRELGAQDAWVTPMYLGGRDGSHHHATLQKLIRHGYAERQRRAGWTRPSYLYRITAAGRALAFP